MPRTSRQNCKPCKSKLLQCVQFRRLGTRHIAEPRLTYCGTAIKRIAMCAIMTGIFLARFSAEGKLLKLTALQLSKLNAVIIVIGPLWSRERTASNGTRRFEIGRAKRTNHNQWQRCNRTMPFVVPAALPSACLARCGDKSELCPMAALQSNAAIFSYLLLRDHVRPVEDPRANRVKWKRCNRTLPFSHICRSERVQSFWEILIQKEDFSFR